MGTLDEIKKYEYLINCFLVCEEIINHLIQRVIYLPICTILSRRFRVSGFPLHGEARNPEEKNSREIFGVEAIVVVLCRHK